MSWEDHEDVIYQRYIKEDGSLKDVMEYMKSHHGFNKTQYETQFKRWNSQAGSSNPRRDRFRKNTQSEVLIEMTRLHQKRTEEGKESVIRINGKLICPRRLKKELRRHAKAARSETIVPSPFPSNVLEVRTPSPSPSTSTSNAIVPKAYFLGSYQLDQPTIWSTTLQLPNLDSLLAVYPHLAVDESTFSLTARKRETLDMLASSQALVTKTAPLFPSHYCRSQRIGDLLVATFKFYLVNDPSVIDGDEKDIFMDWFEKICNKEMLQQMIHGNNPAVHALIHFAFRYAVEDERLRLLDRLLACGINVNEQLWIPSDTTKLQVANYGHKPICALVIAFCSGKTAVADALIRAGAHFIPKSDEAEGEWSILRHIPTDIKTIQLLVDGGVNIGNAPAEDLGSLLVRAVEDLATDTVELLIKKGADVKSSFWGSGRKSYPLEAACSQQQRTSSGPIGRDKVGTVSLLLQAGADPHRQVQISNPYKSGIGFIYDTMGYRQEPYVATPFEVALAVGDLGSIRLLLERMSWPPPKTWFFIVHYLGCPKLGKIQHSRLLEPLISMLQAFILKRQPLSLYPRSNLTAPSHRQLTTPYTNQSINGGSPLDDVSLSDSIRRDLRILPTAMSVTAIHLVKLLWRHDPYVRSEYMKMRFVQAVRSYDESDCDLISDLIKAGVDPQCVDVAQLEKFKESLKSVALEDCRSVRQIIDIIWPVIHAWPNVALPIACYTSHPERVRALLMRTNRELDDDDDGFIESCVFAAVRGLPDSTEEDRMSVVTELVSTIVFDFPNQFEHRYCALSVAIDNQHYHIAQILCQNGTDIQNCVKFECNLIRRLFDTYMNTEEDIEILNFLISLGLDYEGSIFRLALINAPIVGWRVFDALACRGASLLSLIASPDYLEDLGNAVANGRATMESSNWSKPEWSEARHSIWKALAKFATPDYEKEVMQTAFGEEGCSTMIQYASQEGDMETVEDLLAFGKDVNAAPLPERGATALQFASMSGYPGIVDLLIQYGADVNAAGAEEDGRTALEGAAENGRIDVIQILVDNGARIVGPGSEQFEKAMKYAREEGHNATSMLLQQLRDEQMSRLASGELSVASDPQDNFDDWLNSL